MSSKDKPSQVSGQSDDHSTTFFDFHKGDVGTPCWLVRPDKVNVRKELR